MSRKLYAEQALLPTGWAQDVLIEIGADGRITSVQAGAEPSEAGKYGATLPALSNLHSHAFQRGITGLTERRGDGEDDFWYWREAMYALTDALTPEAVGAIAAQLYVELLEAGWGAVAEFHYLHRTPDGGETAPAMLAAAHETGIGLTWLPVLYQRGGFDGRALDGRQALFGADLDAYLRRREAARDGLDRPDDRVGRCAHSLRAVSPDALADLLAATDGPMHIHIAEQTSEVDDCLAATGARPVEWLLGNASVDAGWCLVHATHMTEPEIQTLARSGSVAGVCPTTEADLGDGVFPAPAFLAAGGAFGVGTDSHVRTCPAEELRLLEWSQRLTLRKRNIFAAPGGSTGRALYDGALAGGMKALGRESGAIETGRFADLMALDVDHTALAGRSGDSLLDSWIFAGGKDCVSDVWSAGRHVVREGRHVKRDAIAARYRVVMSALF
jgi:formimidoylglutamate deiminase